MRHNQEGREPIQSRIDKFIVRGDICFTGTDDMVRQYLSAVSAEALFINTDKIDYLAVLYEDEDQCQQSSGYMVFPDGETWHFALNGKENAGVREKCFSVARQIARLYGGALRHWKAGANGEFRWDIASYLS